MAHPESQLQQLVMKWWALAHRGLGVADERLLFAIPNGGKRGKIEACIMKGEGVRAGVCDLFLAVPSGGFHGLFIELKAPDKPARPRPEQATFIEAVRGRGYAAVCMNDWDAVTSLIERYLRGQIGEIPNLASGKT
jgi:hypothetical protein